MASELEKVPGGRPTSFNPERAEKILMAIRGGNYLKVAANYASVHPSTLNRWLQKADDPSAPEEFREFRDALEKARADAEVAAVAKIQLAGSNGNWQAVAWYLERSHPERWGRTDTARIEIVGDGAAAIAGIALTAEGMSALAQRLAQRRAEEEQDYIDAEIIEEYSNELEAGPVESISDSELEEVLIDWEDEDRDD